MFLGGAAPIAASTPLTMAMGTGQTADPGVNVNNNHTWLLIFRCSYSDGKTDSVFLPVDQYFFIRKLFL